MSNRRSLSRRTLLQGLGACLSLPLLEAMQPIASAEPKGRNREATPAPLRLAFVYVPNGAIPDSWTPSETGRHFTLPRSLEPLAPFRDQMTIISGLAQRKAEANGDGPGDHARALATFLTGCQARKTSGADIRVGVSVDQLAARHLQDQTRYASLELGCEAGPQGGNCDSGYSCAYSHNISWRTESTPAAKEIDPRQVFERLFGAQGKEAELARQQRKKYGQSILDTTQSQARDLVRKLGPKDRHKLDEYLTSVREIEQRIARTEFEIKDEIPELKEPMGIPKEYSDHADLMGELLALAFQTDTTRVATFVMANEGSERVYHQLGLADGHHFLTHHGGDRDKIEKVRQINRFHVECFARFAKRLQTVREGDSNLLDQTLIVYGSGIGDGDRHSHHDLPILLMGKGGGTVRVGEHLKLGNRTPLCNLFLSLLDRLGAQVPSMGDSTGRLTEFNV